MGAKRTSARPRTVLAGTLYFIACAPSLDSAAAACAAEKFCGPRKDWVLIPTKLGDDIVNPHPCTCVDRNARAEYHHYQFQSPARLPRLTERRVP